MPSSIWGRFYFVKIINSDKITDVMTWEIAKDVLLDSLKDSAIVFAFIFLFHVILAFFEDKIAKVMTKKGINGPLIGSLFGLIPQCGTSVLAADLYLKKYLTLGTLTAVFLSCSDEALIVLLSSPSHKTLMVIPLVILKFCIGFLCGILVDLIYKKQDVVEEITEELVDVTCEEHHHKDNKIHKYLIHPLVHALELFVYVFIINTSLGLIIASVGEENFANFMVSNKYFAPLFTSAVGLIPNCASSVLISKLFMNGSIPFGALLSGLLVNSGLGFTILFKNKNAIKPSLIVLGICFVVSVIFGYITCLIIGF